jgi:ATP-binding cassette subfamily F protein 3
MDYGGTLIFVSHDRYFVERLATKIVEVGHLTAVPYPGTYHEFLWHKEHPEPVVQPVKPESTSGRDRSSSPARRRSDASADRSAHPGRSPQKSTPARDERKRQDADARRRARAEQTRRAQIEALELRIAETETEIRELEQKMAAPGFYDDRVLAQPTVDRHQTLMWEVGDLMHQWEQLQTASDLAATTDA